MEIELSVLCQDTNWTHKIIDRATADQMTVEAQQAIDNEDDEMQ